MVHQIKMKFFFKEEIDINIYSLFSFIIPIDKENLYNCSVALIISLELNFNL